MLPDELQKKDLMEQLAEANLEQYVVEEENPDEVMYLGGDKQKEMKSLELKRRKFSAMKPSKKKALKPEFKQLP